MRVLFDSLIAMTLIGVLASILLWKRNQHRLLVDSLMALLVTWILASVVVYYREQQREDLQQGKVHQALAVLYEQMLFRGALSTQSPDDPRYPDLVSPVWFPQGLPINNAVPGRQPWLDVAPKYDWSYHPPDPVITGQGQAGFWYNPNRGIFRARVVPQWSETATLRLYNELNHTTLKEFPHFGNELRPPQPLAHLLEASLLERQPATLANGVQSLSIAGPDTPDTRSRPE